MDQNTNMETQTPSEKIPVGNIVGIVIIVLVLSFGAFYSFNKGAKEIADGANALPQQTQTADVVVSQLSTQGTSNDINAIEKDAQATDLSTLDAGLNDLAL